MRRSQRKRGYGYWGILLLWMAPVLAASGHVVDPDGKPVPGARACLMVGGADGFCAITDEAGYYGLPDSEVPFVRISALGFLPKQLAAVDQDAPIVLDRAAGLRVRLLDLATGEPIPHGEVFVTYPTGKKKGPFPTNLAGVRVSSLEPGEIVVRGTAPDHLEARSDVMRLENGAELEVVLRLGASPRTP